MATSQSGYKTAYKKRDSGEAESLSSKDGEVPKPAEQLHLKIGEQVQNLSQQHIGNIYEHPIIYR